MKNKSKSKNQNKRNYLIVTYSFLIIGIIGIIIYIFKTYFYDNNTLTSNQQNNNIKNNNEDSPQITFPKKIGDIIENVEENNLLKNIDNKDILYEDDQLIMIKNRSNEKKISGGAVKLENTSTVIIYDKITKKMYLKNINIDEFVNMKKEEKQTFVHNLKINNKHEIDALLVTSDFITSEIKSENEWHKAHKWQDKVFHQFKNNNEIDGKYNCGGYEYKVYKKDDKIFLKGLNKDSKQLEIKFLDYIENYFYLLDNVYIDCKPKEWTRKYILTEEYQRDSEKTIVFSNIDDELNIIKELTKKREPYNLSMDRIYNETKLEEKFGYKTGKYEDEKYRKNIAIYCYTPWKDNLNNKIHLLSVYGLALDSQNQPDYIDYQKLNTDDEKDKKITDTYESIFSKILQCAIYISEIKEIIVPGIGIDSFLQALHETEKERVINIFFGIFEKYIKIFKKFDLKLIYGWYNQDSKKIPSDNKLEYDIKTYPDHQNNNKTLYVNAWDPWSFVGNGHDCDYSFDGFIGERTAAAALSSEFMHPNGSLKYFNETNLEIKLMSLKSSLMEINQNYFYELKDDLLLSEKNEVDSTLFNFLQQFFQKDITYICGKILQISQEIYFVFISLLIVIQLNLKMMNLN